MNLRVTLNEQERTFNLGFDAKYAGGGTSDHSQLINRDAANQHPMSAITGLEAALGEKQPKGNYLTEHQPIKTINGQSLVGEGNIQIGEGTVVPPTGDYTQLAEDIEEIKETIEEHERAIEGKQPKGDYLTEHQPLKTINGESLVGEGDIQISGVQREEILVADLGAAVRAVAEDDPLVFPAHNGSMILCSTTANDATFSDRAGATRYLIPIPANSERVTVETTDEKVTLIQFIGVKGGTYKEVFRTERGAENSCEFEKGVADYIAINMIYEDTGAVTVPWDYDVTKTTTVAFSVSASGGLPAVTTADNDKLLQVVDGKWTVVALKGSTIETYIDEYISEALGGEY